MDECPRVSEIINAMESKNYLVFSNPGGHDLNIVGIRTADEEIEIRHCFFERER